MSSRRYQRRTRNASMLKGSLLKEGFEFWYHFFWAVDKENGEKKAFFIEFLRVNPSMRKRKKNAPTLDKDKFSFAMVRAGSVDGEALVAEFFPDDEVDTSSRILSLRFGKNICLEDNLTGNIIHDEKGVGVRFGFCKSGTISWDLTVNKPIRHRFNLATSPFIQFINPAQMYWYIGGLKAEYSGSIVVNNREFMVENSESFGYQDKTWGSHYSKKWLKVFGGYLMKDETRQAKSAFMLALGEPVLFNRSLGTKFFIMLSHNGILYDFSYLTPDHTHYHYEDEILDDHQIKVFIEARNSRYKIEIELLINQQKLSVLNYPTPQGALTKFGQNTITSGSIHLYHHNISLVDWTELHTLSLHDSCFQCNFDSIVRERKDHEQS